MIPANAAGETGTRSVKSCSAQRRDAQPSTPIDQRDVLAPSSKGSHVADNPKEVVELAGGWLGSSRRA